MFKKICNCGGVHIRLIPDFSSNGMWCNKCGAEIDENITNLPDELIKKIYAWSNYWDKYITDKGYKDYKVPKGFNDQGLKLAIEIKKYHPCFFSYIRRRIGGD